MSAIQPSRAESLVHLAGIFDRGAALALRRDLEALPAGMAVRLDFSRVGEVHDLGLAEVASLLAQRPNMTIRGLRQHHARLLRYFGVAPEIFGGAAPECRGD